MKPSMKSSKVVVTFPQAGKSVELSVDQLRRVVDQAALNLSKLKKIEGSTFPTSDRELLHKLQDISFICFNDYEL